MIVYDKYGTILSKGDKVTFGVNDDWVIDKIAGSELKLSRHGVRKTMDPDSVIKTKKQN